MSSILRGLLFTVSATQVAASCAYGTHLMPRAEHGVEIKSFGYTGGMGPANWHSLNTTLYHECATGLNQSPIDLVDGVYTEVSGSQFSINIPDFESGAVFENIGTAVEVVGEGGTLIIPGSNKTFNFAQFHFHLPSEHLDNGTAMAMEMHMVFQAEDTEIAVLGTYIDITSGSAAAKRQTDSGASTMLETLFSSVGEISAPGTATTTSALVMSEVISMLSSTTFKSYSGSLTTPPCTEGVNWFVASDTLSVTVDTWKSARDVIGFNSRFAQSAPGTQNALSMAAEGMTAMAASGLA
ncbi:hypothetical protein N0V93_010029 [Gnomoniopsis smithogilvyi]|uniref:carbonic anhydrase n=1 Tax=Gnomoniopsis smithogilvyi TaxID=1191159 RepID=A0A9W9CSX0_9PEZI|nr:hypothetical protein N0V93_010029 [Gnomoniopsis smithogilvyi]